MAFNNEELKQLGELNKRVLMGGLMQFWDEVLEPNMVVKKDLEEFEDKINKKIGTLATQAHVDSRFDALEKSMTEK